MNPQTVAEPKDGPTLQWMQRMAKTKQAAVLGSMICQEQHAYFNRLLFVFPNGDFKSYDKRHLFAHGGEDIPYTAGGEFLEVEYLGWRIRPLICYDLRFPIWSRNHTDYELLIYVANWPAKRKLHWKRLLQARAIENQSYCLGLNRVGSDPNGLNYSGDSAIFDYGGELLSSLAHQSGVLLVQLDKIAQKNYRARLNFLPDRDHFEIIDK